jgi:hypothetical protein
VCCSECDGRGGRERTRVGMGKREEGKVESLGSFCLRRSDAQTGDTEHTGGGTRVVRGSRHRTSSSNRRSTASR